MCTLHGACDAGLSGTARLAGERLEGIGGCIQRRRALAAGAGGEVVVLALPGCFPCALGSLRKRQVSSAAVKRASERVKSYVSTAGEI